MDQSTTNSQQEKASIKALHLHSHKDGNFCGSKHGSGLPYKLTWVPGVVSQHGASILCGGVVFESRVDVSSDDADAVASSRNTTGIQRNVGSVHLIN